MRFIKTTFATPWICLWMSNFKIVLRIQKMLRLSSPLSVFDPHFLTMEFEIDRRRYFEFVPEIKLMFGNFRIVTRMSKCILINSVINDPYLVNVFVACESKLKSHKNVSWHPWVKRRVFRGWDMETVNPIYILISVKPFLWHLGSGQESVALQLPGRCLCHEPTINIRNIPWSR